MLQEPGARACVIKVIKWSSRGRRRVDPVCRSSDRASGVSKQELGREEQKEKEEQEVEKEEEKWEMEGEDEKQRVEEEEKKQKVEEEEKKQKVEEEEKKQKVEEEEKKQKVEEEEKQRLEEEHKQREKDEREKEREEEEREENEEAGESLEESSVTEPETERTHTFTDQSVPEQPEPAGKEESLACQTLSVSTKTSDRQLLLHHISQPLVDPSPQAPTPDCPHESSAGCGASGGHQSENREVWEHGGMIDGPDPAGMDWGREQASSDLFCVEGDQENPKNTASLENFENQDRQTPNQSNQEGTVPTVMVTNVEEAQTSLCGQTEDSAESEKQEDTMPADANLASSLSDITDFSGSDLQSLKSDTLSLLSETAISGKEGTDEDTRSVATSSVMEGPEDDTRSVTASSVMSLFHRMQMDPLEREWLRCAALGNAPGLRQLLLQDPTLAPKKMPK
ncbi:myb-like protein X [Hoplias malabaricus]|uniref:myb-like protein X n=1 Tax=Hoplias malabaricus TaxID=27720 RepID=UPI0034629D8F